MPCSYFLLQVTSDGVIPLQKDTKSEYGHLYLAGTKIVKGHYLNYERKSKGGYAIQIKAR